MIEPCEVSCNRRIEMEENFKIKLTWKQRLVAMFVMAFTYALFLYLGGTNQSVKTIIIQGVIYGVLFILIFPWIMKKMLGKRIDTLAPKLISEEKIDEEIPGSLFRGIEAVGGKIFLTNQRLIFINHSLNIQKGQTNIDYSEMKSVEKRKTMKIVNNGIKVTTRDVQVQRIKDKLAV